VDHWRLTSRWLWISASALVLVLLALKAMTVRVTSTSMAPTLCPGDYLLTLGIGPSAPLRPLVRARVAVGSIAVVMQREADGAEPQMIVKRVMALGDERVRIREGKVLINDKPIADTFAHHQPHYVPAEDSWPLEPEGDGARNVRVPANAVFLLGDNRDESADSRMAGSVPRNDIVGLMMVKIRPLNSIKCE
jgi:signal peptidase I